LIWALPLARAVHSKSSRHAAANRSCGLSIAIPNAGFVLHQGSSPSRIIHEKKLRSALHVVCQFGLFYENSTNVKDENEQNKEQDSPGKNLQPYIIGFDSRHVIINMSRFQHDKGQGKKFPAQIKQATKNSNKSDAVKDNVYAAFVKVKEVIGGFFEKLHCRERVNSQALIKKA
jgi:hypothetical protein